MNEGQKWLFERFAEAAERPALIWHDITSTYGDLSERTAAWRRRLDTIGVTPGEVVAVVGDYLPYSVPCLLALLQRGAILMPLSAKAKEQHEAFLRIGEADRLIEIDGDGIDAAAVTSLDFRRGHRHLESLRRTRDTGLLLFSSGSCGTPKAILHRAAPLLDKLRRLRQPFRTFSFLLFDHIGGFNTIFHTLANQGCLVATKELSVSEVCRAIETHRVELLPTSPSFINLLLLSGGHESYDLSSLSLVTYGTELMPAKTLRSVKTQMPWVRLKQTYGLSELGIFQSKSKSDNSLLVKVGGDGYETKIENGTLWVRSRSSMVGYLNYPTPFDDEGWFDTGDLVTIEGEFLRFRGRAAEIINVGGQKVHPAEVEAVLAEMPGVEDVAVSGSKHLLLGATVEAAIQRSEEVSDRELKRRVVGFCRGRLQPFMIPTKVHGTAAPLVSHRYKKVRGTPHFSANLDLSAE